MNTQETTVGNGFTAEVSVQTDYPTGGDSTSTIIRIKPSDGVVWSVETSEANEHSPSFLEVEFKGDQEYGVALQVFEFMARVLRDHAKDSLRTSTA